MWVLLYSSATLKTWIPHVPSTHGVLLGYRRRQGCFAPARHSEASISVSSFVLSDKTQGPCGWDKSSIFDEDTNTITLPLTLGQGIGGRPHWSVVRPPHKQRESLSLFLSCFKCTARHTSPDGVGVICDTERKKKKSVWLAPVNEVSLSRKIEVGGGKYTVTEFVHIKLGSILNCFACTPSSI